MACLESELGYRSGNEFTLFGGPFLRSEMTLLPWGQRAPQSHPPVGEWA